MSAARDQSRCGELSTAIRCRGNVSRVPDFQMCPDGLAERLVAMKDMDVIADTFFECFCNPVDRNAEQVRRGYRQFPHSHRWLPRCNYNSPLGTISNRFAAAVKIQSGHNLLIFCKRLGRSVAVELLRMSGFAQRNSAA